MKILNKTILVFLFFGTVNSQSSKRDYSEELRYQNDAINKMKKEIEALSSKLRKANINETTTSKRITNLEEEIALVNKLIQSLKKEETSNTRVFQPMVKNPFTDRFKRGCEWPEGHPDEQEFHFCEKERFEDKPYCLYHCAIAYVLPEKEEDKTTPKRVA